MKIPSRRSIRLDEVHTIKLRVSKWFPEMILLTVLLAAAGSFFYGNQISNTSSFSTQHVVKQNHNKKPTKISKSDLTVHSATTNEKTLSPVVIVAETKSPNIGIQIESATIVGKKAHITYHIHNRSKNVSSGTTWVSGAFPDKGKQKMSWKAKYFTIKTATVPLKTNGPNEIKIFVSDDVANANNSYLVRF